MAATRITSDLCMIKIAGLDAIERGDYETARRMENTLRAVGRDDVADEIYAAGCAHGSQLRARLAAGADYARGSEIIGARVLAAAAHLH